MAVASSLRGEGISNQRTRLSTARMLNVAALVVGAAGILMQYFSGVGGFPTIPPGPIILVVAAAVVALGPWRWTPVVGIIAPLFVLVGGAIATTANWGVGAPLSAPAEVIGFSGALVQFLGVITALVAGIVALKRDSEGSVIS
ncbi:MAG TPA: hypothetical protein VE975_09310 [Actinomycetota bacterium]|nr:hypothetical protein [Actinomycetota bacterium]